MKQLRLITALAFSTTACTAAPAGGDAESDAVTNRTAAAFATLTDVLQTDSSTKQIHAADVLIAFGRAAEVHQWFAQSTEPVDDVPVRRVVVWRARAASAPTATERAAWIDRIFAITATPGLPDRVHAIESIAKLGAVPPPDLVPVLQRWDAVAPEREQVFSRWALWPVDPPADPGTTLTAWLNSSDPITRLRAAYVTRWLGAPEPAYETLVRLADETTGSDQVAAIVLASACLLEPTPQHVAAWRTQLERIARGDDSTATYHAFQGLMAGYERKDLSRVSPLLEADDADVRVAAAWTILTVELAQRPPGGAAHLP